VAFKYEKLYNNCNHQLYDANNFINKKYDERKITLNIDNSIAPLIHVQTKDNTNKSISDIVNTSKIIFRYDDKTACMECVEHTFKILNLMADSIGYNNVILITKFERIEHLKILLTRLKINFTCYNYKNDWIPIIENCKLPHREFIFVLGTDMRINFPKFIHSTDSINDYYYTRLFKYFNQM
jgi:hypothetical protein